MMNRISVALVSLSLCGLLALNGCKSSNSMGFAENAASAPSDLKPDSRLAATPPPAMGTEAAPGEKPAGFFVDKVTKKGNGVAPLSGVMTSRRHVRWTVN